MQLLFLGFKGVNKRPPIHLRDSSCGLACNVALYKGLINHISPVQYSWIKPFHEGMDGGLVFTIH